MFTIRQESIDAFHRQDVEDYVDRVAPILGQIFPKALNDIGMKGIAGIVRRGIDDSARYGIDQEISVFRYICLMFSLGSDFDRNPSYPWARAILQDNKIVEQNERLDHLTAAAGNEASTLFSKNEETKR